MTSTNDGKDVKSNQTSGHNGKSYYIELYKSLEKALSGENSLEERTSHVCEAWRRVYSLYAHSAPSTHPHLLSWLQRHTAHTVLQSKWAESKNEHARLTAAIDSLVAEATAQSANREQHPWEQLLLQRAAWFRKTLGNPWGHPVLKSLINPNGDPVTDQQILEWLIEERGVVLVTRLRQLVSAGNCDDLALLLAAAVMDRARAAIPRAPDDCAADRVEEQEDPSSFVAVLERDASFTADIWELLTDIELVLLLKTDKRPRCIDLAKLTPLRHGYAMVERLRNRLVTSPRDKKLWKHAKEAATLVTQVVIARCMVLQSCTGVCRAALYSCARSLARLVPAPRLRAVCATLAAPAHSARHLHTFCAALDAQCSEEMKPFICELYVRALTAGMNELEQFKLNSDKATEARAMEQTLASWFTQLGALLAGSARLRAECALTAFSVHPATNYYERVAHTNPPTRLHNPQEPTPDTKEATSEFGSWANDSRTQSNLVKTSETLQMKKTEQHQANVLSTAILTEGETLGLEPELCQDLAVLLSGPRVKTLSWDTDRNVLLENCRAYMERTDGGTRAVTTELKFLNLDPAAYRHLPEEGDDESDIYYGIEKGYEHEVQLEDPEEIWQNAFFDPEQTESANDSEIEQISKKKVRAPAASSGDDEDPLSTIADAKREKKIAKEKSKERRRKKSHKQDTDKDGIKERRKKEKKTKKESKKNKSERTTGSLTSLLGMKVSNMPSQVQDGQKKVRKKKDRPRDSMFSYVSVTDSDYDSQAQSQLPTGDPNILIDGVFPMDELKSPERSEDNQKPIDNTKTTLIKSDRVQCPVINDFKSRPIVSSPRLTTSSDSDASRSKSPFFTLNHLANRHVVSSKVKSSITKLLQFRRKQNQIRGPPKIPAQCHMLGASDKSVANQGLVGMKILNPEEVPKVYTNKKQQLEPIESEVSNLTNAIEGSNSEKYMPHIPCKDMSADQLQNMQNLLNLQKPKIPDQDMSADKLYNTQNLLNVEKPNISYNKDKSADKLQSTQNLLNVQKSKIPHQDMSVDKVQSTQNLWNVKKTTISYKDMSADKLQSTQNLLNVQKTKMQGMSVDKLQNTQNLLNVQKTKMQGMSVDKLQNTQNLLNVQKTKMQGMSVDKLQNTQNLLNVQKTKISYKDMSAEKLQSMQNLFNVQKTKIPYKDMSVDRLQSTQNLNVQKPSRQYTNVAREVIQNVFDETRKINSEYVQHSPLKSVQQSNYMTIPTPSVSKYQTNYSSPTKSDVTPHALNLSPPKPTMSHQPFHKSMQNLSSDNTKQEVPKKPLLINDPNYLSQQNAKTSQLSPRIISNTIIKPPSQTVTSSHQYKVNIIKEDLIKSAQRHAELSRINLSKGSAQNVTSQISNSKSDFIKYGQKSLISSMHNVNDTLSSNDVNRQIFTPSDVPPGNASQSKLSRENPDLPCTSSAYYTNNSSSVSRCTPVQDIIDRKSRQNFQTPKPVVGLNSDYQEFLKELAKYINAGSTDPGKNVSIALNKEVKVTPVLTPSVSKKADSVIPQCAKQKIQQKKTENAPKTFSRLSCMHKNKQIENKVNLNDTITMELNKNIRDHKITKAKYMNNEVTISRVGVTHTNVRDQGNFIQKNELTCSKLQKACPVLTGILDSPVKNSQSGNLTNINQRPSETQTDREHADLLLLLRNQPVSITNPNSSVTPTSESTCIQASNTQSKIDQALLGAKVKNINTVLNILPVKTESTSEDNKPEWEQVMNDISAHRTKPLGPNALDMVLKKDKRHSQSSSRPHATQKSTKITGDSTPQSKQSEPKKRDQSSSQNNSSSRQSGTETHAEISKRHRLPDIVKKPSSTEMQKRLEIHKNCSSNTSKNDDTFISEIPNSAYDMLGDLMDDDLRQELGELSSDEEAYTAPNVPLTKVKNNTNIPNAGITCNVAKESPQIVAPKTVVCKNESTSNLVGRTIPITSTTGYTNVIASNASHIDATRSPTSYIDTMRLPGSHIDAMRLSETRPTVVCSNTDRPHTATVIANQIVQHTANNFMTNHNNMEPNCFIGNIEPASVIIASLPVPIPAQPVVVIRQDVVYDQYTAIRIQETQVTAGLCSVNQNVYAINNAPNIAVYQTTQFAAPVINPVIIGNAMTTSNVSNAVAMAEQQVAPDSRSVDVNTQEPDSTTLPIKDRPKEDDNKPSAKSTNLDVNMNRNCERKVLSQVQEKHPNENVDKDSLTRMLSVDDKPVATKQDEERIKLKRQTLINRKISHACFHPPIPLTYTPLSKNDNLGKDTSKNGTVKLNRKLLPHCENGINKYISLTRSDKDVAANYENLECTDQVSSVKENQKTCRRIWLRSSRVSDAKVSPEKQTKRNRRKIKLKISDTVIKKITNLENENNDSIKPTRSSSRILNKKKSSVPESLSPTQTQQNCVANSELIDFEEELSGSKILKTSIITPTEVVLKKELECDTVADSIKPENNKCSDITAKEHRKLECKKEAGPVFESSKKFINHNLEPTVVIEKLKNNFGDQLLISNLLVKAQAKESEDVESKVFNRTALRSKSVTDDCVTPHDTCIANKFTVRVTTKNAGSVKSIVACALDKANKVPMTSPTVILDRAKLNPAIVVEQKVISSSKAITNVSATTQQKYLKDLPEVVHKLEIKNNHTPTFKNNAAPLDGKKSLPAAEVVANKVVTQSDTSKTMVQKTSPLRNNESQTNQTVELQPQPKIANMNPEPIVRQFGQRGVEPTKQSLHSMQYTPTSSIIPNDVSLKEVNTIQNVPLLPKGECLQDSKIDPKATVALSPLAAIRPTQTEQRKDVVEPTVQTLNDTKMTPANNLPSSNVSSLLNNETEKLCRSGPKVTIQPAASSSGTTPIQVMPENASEPAKLNNTDLGTPTSTSETIPIQVMPENVSDPVKLKNTDPVSIPPTNSSVLGTVPIEVMPEAVSTIVQGTTSLVNDNTEKVNKTITEPTAPTPSMETLSAEVTPKVDMDPKPTGTRLDALSTSKTVLSNVKSKGVATTQKETRASIAQKDDQQVVNESEVEDLREIEDTKANSVPKEHFPGDIKNNDAQMKVNPGKSLLCDENIIEIPDDDSSPQSNANDSTQYIPRKGGPITCNKNQEGLRTIITGDLKIEELVPVSTESDKKRFRITYPSGIPLIVTLSGKFDGDLDTLFSNPTMTSILARGLKDTSTRYTLNYKQILIPNKDNPAKILDKKIHSMNIKRKPDAGDTILISDDEEEVETRSFVTEFGKYRTNVDHETHTKHQKKFGQKCTVKLCRQGIFKSNKTKPKPRSCLSVKTSLMTRTKSKLSGAAIATEITSELDSNTKMFSLATKQETLQTPPLEQASNIVNPPEVIEIDESSNDSIDITETDNENVEPVKKILALKNLLLDDLGVGTLSDTDKNTTLPVKNKPVVDDLKNALLQDLGVVAADSPIIDITSNEEEDYEVIAENPVPNSTIKEQEEMTTKIQTTKIQKVEQDIIKDCVLRIRKCDNLVKRYELMKTMKKCYVKLVHLDNSVNETATLQLNEKTNNKETDESNQDNGEEVIEFDVEETGSPQLSRHPSLSILNNWDDECQLSTDSPSCTSPVMETYETIVQLRTRALGETEPLSDSQNIFFFSCFSEWRLTKLECRTQEINRSSLVSEPENDEHKMIISDCDSIVSDDDKPELTFKVLKLSTLSLQFLDENPDVIYRLQSTHTMRSISKTNTPPNKLKRKTDEGVKNTAASKILKLGTIALNTFNSYMNVGNPFPDSEEGTRSNSDKILKLGTLALNTFNSYMTVAIPIPDCEEGTRSKFDKCILVEVINKHHEVMPSLTKGTEPLNTEANHATTTEEEHLGGYESIVEFKTETDNVSNEPNRREMDLKGHGDSAEESSSSKKAGFVDEQNDTSQKTILSNYKDESKMQICVGTEAICKHAPNDRENVISGACLEHAKTTNLNLNLAKDGFDEVSIHETTNITGIAIDNEKDILTSNIGRTGNSKTDTFTETSVNSTIEDTDKSPPVNNRMESQLVENNDNNKTNNITSLVRVILDDIIDKINQLEKVETSRDCISESSESDSSDGERYFIESENQENEKAHAIENNQEVITNTICDIMQLDAEEFNKTSTLAQDKTAIETYAKNSELFKIQTGNDESNDSNKVTILPLYTSTPKTTSNERQTCTDVNREQTEIESNSVNIANSEKYEIPIEHLFHELYEVEIVDNQTEDVIDIVEILSEPSPEPVPVNEVSPLEVQSHDSEIISPVYIDNKEIVFNYHDYTKRPKQKHTSKEAVNDVMPCLVENVENNDSNSVNEESDINNSRSNSKIDLEQKPCLKETFAEASEIEVNSITKNYHPKSDTNCKYELIQNDDWLTVIKTENDKDDYETRAAFLEPSDVLEEKMVVASLCSKNTTIDIKGFEYDDVYIFPLSDSGTSSNTSSDSLEQEMNSEVLKCNSLKDDIHNIDYSVITPKVTYSRKCLKRKTDMKEIKVAEKKYRKGKNIDCPKLIATSMAESAYGKEYKRLLEYCSSVKFSYSLPFHKELVEVDDLASNWPINSRYSDVPDDVTDKNLFSNKQETDTFQPDPATQTLAEEISYEYANSDATQENPSNEASEQNFKMGFGEGSGRVIQILKTGGESNISAATLSDVKQSQPVFKSVHHDLDNLKTNTEDQIMKIRQHVNFILLRDKVRSFFKKCSVELKSDWLQENKGDDFKSRFHTEQFPFDLCSLNYVKPIPSETIVQVVQVGQLPVSAAAQNPVTCDPRVTQVSDASPSQCSVDNSPNDDSQSEIKTEYTELTTADLTIPLQEYAQQNQAGMNLASHDCNVEVIEQTISLEMEIKAEETPVIKEEMPDIKEEKSNSSDTELHTLTNATPENVNYSFENNKDKSDMSSIIYDSSEQNSSETFSQQRQQNGTSEKTDQIAHAMNAAGITTTPETITNTRAHALVNILSQKIRQGSVNNAQTATNTYSKTTSINAMALQQALAQILPPPLNQTGSSESNQSQSTSVGPQVLHIVQGKNASGNQITLVDNSQQSVISTANATQVLHIVQNKSATPGQASNGTLTPQANSFSGLSLVDAGLQQGGNQLLHIVNTGNQKTASPGQLLKRVNLLTNLTNVQGSNEQKMVQFVCKSADGKAIQLNAPHQRSMVLRLQPIEAPNVQTPPAKPAESQELSSSPTSTASKDSASQQEIKSRSIYEENYAKFIQNSSSKTPGLEKSTSLPKFNQAFGKPVFQEGSQKQAEATSNNSHLPPVNTNTENSECTATDSAINLEHIGQISSPPLLLRKQPAVTTQSQPNIVQQIKQTIAPMNIQTMHGGVIYTRQIPVNIGGGQTINLITVPSTELINDDTPKPQTQTSQGDIEPSIIKIVPQSQTNTNTENTQEEINNHASGSSESTPTPQPQPVLTQMRIKLPMLSKAPQMVPGARVVRPSFFQIQRNVIGGANQPVYQQLVLTAAPPLGQQTIRLPQAQASRPIKVPSESQSSSSESQMSSSTLEQLREFDMVLEQVKERSTVQPSTNTTTNSSFKIHTSSSDTTDGNASSNCSTESAPQVLYSIGNNQSLNVAYVNRKTTVTTPTTSTYVRSPDSTGIADSPTSSTHAQIPHTVTTDSSPTDMSSQSKPAKVGSKSKSRPKSTSNPPNTLKLNTVPPKTSSQKPLEDEQTTQRILYILAEYKEQVENSPDKDKPAPRRRSNPPSNPGSSKRKKSSSSRRSGTRDMSPIHGEDTCRTMGSEDSSCGTSQGDCTESCLDSHSPQDSPRKVARKITFDQDITVTQPRPQPQRNVIVADGQTITVARGTTGKPATAVLMPANYILPVSMVKGGQQIAIVTNRGPKLLTVGGEGGATNALLLQRLIGPAGLKPVLARPGVRHVRLPTAALHNLQAFNLATATTVQPPDSTASPTPGPAPPELSDTRATSSPWTDRDDVKPERGSSPEGSEPWNLPSSADAHEYTYEETVRTDNMDRTVLDPIPDRYSPDMEAQRIFDKMFDVDSKKSYAVDSPRCAYDIDPSDCDDKPYQVVQKKDGSQRQHRLSHVSAAALRHKYAILEHELRLQKSLSEECEDLGVDSPSASDLFPEAELLFANSPAHEHNQDAHHSHTPQPLQSSTIPQPDMDDQIATDHLIPREIDVSLGLGDVGIVAVSEDGMQATIALDQEEFARSHPNTTFHSEPTEGEVQPFTIAGLKGRHITSTIFHSSSAPATVLMAAPQATVISQAPDHAVKYEIDNMINSMPSSHNNDINLSSVLVKDDGLTRFDNILTDSRELHLTNTASAIVHSSGNATQVIRRVCYEDDKRERDTRYLIDEPDNLIAGDDAKMIAEDSSRDATMESMADVDDDRSSPERHAELFWESNSASERSESRRPLDFSSDSDKCCKSPSFDETNSTDSSGVGTHMRLDSVIKEARGRDRSGSADGSSADDAHPPLRTYPPKRLYHPLEGEVERSLSGKTRAGERSPDSLEVRRRASGRGVVKRGCHCCNGSPAPPRPKKPRQRKPTLDFNTNT